MKDNQPGENPNEFNIPQPKGIVSKELWQKIIEMNYERVGGMHELYILQSRMDKLLTAIFQFSINELEIPEKWDIELDELSEICDEGYLQKYYSSRLILLKIPWLYNIDDDRKN